jgi:sulfur-oxidizing protein SoxX
MPRLTGFWRKNLPALIVLSAAASMCGASAQTAPIAPEPLVAYHVQGDAIVAPLTSTPGDPAEGRKVVLDRKLGNCLSCHSMPLKAEDQGTIGPDLHGVGARLSPAQLRLRLVNMKVIDPHTIMPAYYRVDGLTAVGKAFAGKPILTAQQIEDVVAFLTTAKTQGAQ